MKIKYIYVTGTAKEASGEFWQIYRLPVISIPTNIPCVRKQLPDHVFLTSELKVKKIHQTQRPILVGTRNVASSEQLSKNLKDAGMDCEIINAVRHEGEARIVAQAGEKGLITIATNIPNNI